MSVTWKGVIPAATTQFAEDFSVDVAATQQVQDNLVRDGVHGLIVMGTVGENNSLEPAEKKRVLEAAVEAVDGRIPVIAGVSELDSPRAAAFARDAEKIGADGLMVLPAMVYVPTEQELVAHFRTVAAASGLPIMLYNNPPSYRVNISVAALEQLSDVKSIVALKESSLDTRRFTDLYNALGDRFALFAGLDDVALEGLVLGAKGWISGLSNAFPQESIALWRAVEAGDLATARTIYRWFMPLLHLDAEHDLVQAIKVVDQMLGRGNGRVRSPRLALAPARRAEVERIVEKALATRPRLAA